MLARFGVGLLLLASAGAARDEYEAVGNGWCLDESGHRLKLGPDHFRHAEEVAWSSADVDSDSRARACERRCSATPRSDCVGYMTEDKQQCTLIRRRDHHAEDGIASTDAERRNFCWRRVVPAVVDDASSCEVTVRWPDGREEPRECIAYL